MQSEWKVTSNRINGETMYAVFRIRNTSEVDHSGNREYAGQWTANKQVAIEIAKSLNTDSK